MTNAEALKIIESLRGEAPHYDLGLLDILEIMTDERREGGEGYFREVYTTEQCQAYAQLMSGFQELFFGATA